MEVIRLKIFSTQPTLCIDQLQAGRSSDFKFIEFETHVSSYGGGNNFRNSWLKASHEFCNTRKASVAYLYRNSRRHHFLRMFVQDHPKDMWEY
jgi:hypothetical protein